MLRYGSMTVTLLALLLAGCSPFSIVTTSISAGRAIAEERSTGEIFDDAKIRAQILHYYLQTDTNDLLINVTVRVSQGRVLLTGTVRDQKTAVEAVRLAWLAAGVQEVNSELTVTGAGDPARFAQDAIISGQVKSRLLLTENIRSVNYTVVTEQGVVYLIGIAQNARELQTAAHVAASTRGVRRVISYVRLKEEIEQERRAERGH